MTDSIAEQVLEAASKRFDQAEVFEEHGESRGVSFEDNRLKEINSSQFHGIGLRIVHEGRIGFTGTTNLRDVERILEMAQTSALYGDRARFELQAQPTEVPDVKTWDDEVQDVDAARMVEMGAAGLEISRAASEEYLYSCGISCSTHHQRILNGAGLDVRSSSTGMGGHVNIQEVNENGTLNVNDSKGWAHPIDGISDLVENVVSKARDAARIVKPKREKMPVLLPPRALGLLLGPVGLALNGKLVHKGSSVLKDRMGDSVFDERVTITDDPTSPWRGRTCATDDEGIVARQRPLFENGVLRRFLTDLQTAGQLGCEPGGNGFRGYGSRPSPGTTNTVIEPGKETMDTVIGGLKRGVIVEQVLGGGQSNTLAGEFSVNLELGFLVENGQIVGRVKDAMIAGNVYKLLKDHLLAISSDREWRGSMHAPAFLIGGITLAVDQ